MIKLPEKILVALSLFVLSSCGQNELPENDAPRNRDEPREEGSYEEDPDFTQDGEYRGNTLPENISELNVFENGDPFRPTAKLRAFDVRVTLWSDGLGKDRYLYIPNQQKISLDSQGSNFKFPIGTMFVKQFYRDIGGNRKPIETRIMRLQSGGKWEFGNYL